ncbi:MAG: hypothetical protein KDA38_11780, partial [Planctomycetales bacterium]|nr:hypothetical protein [Planctomycetales bacterium]
MGSRRSKSEFRRAVLDVPAIAGGLCDGLQAVRTADKRHLRISVPESLVGSVDVDSTLKTAFPNAPRWDYAIGYHCSNRKVEVVYWVEIHPASDGEIKVVLAKLEWLRGWLRENANRL